MPVFLYINHNSVEFKQWKFPGGEVGVKLINTGNTATDLYEVQVTDVPSSDDIFVALNLLDAISRRGVSRKRVTLRFSYLPYARQDRVCSPGESFALDVFLGMLISMQHTFWQISFDDVHSKVAINILRRSTLSVSNFEQDFFTEYLPEFDVIIAPDKGAVEKAKLTQPDKQHIFLDKVRVDGKVQYENYAEDTIVGKACIVDDLVDGGQTFISAAKMLRETQPRMTSLSLYCTHGIFSKGFDTVKESFEDVFVSNPMTTEAKKAKLVPF